MDNSPKTLADLVYSERLLKTQLSIIDIGSRGEIPREWQKYQNLLFFIGFEPDSAECQRLNSTYKDKNWVFCPYAIGDKNRVAPFYITRFPDSSGIIKGTASFLERLGPLHRDNLETVDAIDIQLFPLSDALSTDSTNFKPYFLKIDVEGAEDQILTGAESLFENGEILGVKTEVWMGPIKDKSEFNKIDCFMMKHGLFLFDIQVQRYPRRPFHRGKILCSNGYYFLTGYAGANLGQVLTGDILYLKDPIWDYTQNNGSSFIWDDEHILKMCFIYDAYGLFDCAVELINFYDNNFKTGLPVDHILDTLIPPLPTGQRLSYKEYIQVTLQIPWIEANGYIQSWRNRPISENEYS